MHVRVRLSFGSPGQTHQEIPYLSMLYVVRVELYIARRAKATVHVLISIKYARSLHVEIRRCTTWLVFKECTHLTDQATK